jgi:uncharacterized membrane protein
MRLPFFAAPARSVPARIRQLDVLRGIAVLFVLGHHKYIAPFLVQMGWVGVDLFFTDPNGLNGPSDPPGTGASGHPQSAGAMTYA